METEKESINMEKGLNFVLGIIETAKYMIQKSKIPFNQRVDCYLMKEEDYKKLILDIKSMMDDIIDYNDEKKFKERYDAVDWAGMILKGLEKEEESYSLIYKKLIKKIYAGLGEDVSDDSDDESESEVQD